MLCLKKNLKVILIILITGIFIVYPINSQEEKKLIDMTLGELLNIEITTAGRKLHKISDTPASVVLITRDEIETYGYSTLSEILDNIPGLYSLNDYSEYGSSFGIRGFWSGVANNNMTILINGVSQVNDLQSNYPFPKITVPVEAIERIEVIRGPMSVIYGNGAFYGVINVFTDDSFYKHSSKPSKRNYGNQVTVTAGSGNTKKLFLRTSGKKNDFSYVFNGSIFDTHGIDQPLDEMMRAPETLLYYGVPVNQRTGGSLEYSDKHFNFSGSFKNFFIHFFYNESSNEPYYLMPSFSEGTKATSDVFIGSFGYRKKITEKIAINGKLNYIQNRDFQKYDFLFADFYGIQQLESNAWEAEINTFLNPSDNLELTAGLYYRKVMKAINLYDLPSFNTITLVNNYFYLPGNDSIETRAFFTQANYKLFRNFNIIAGCRLEQMPKYYLAADLAAGTESFTKISNVYDQDNIEIIPRLAFIYKLNKNNIFKFLYGNAINRPSYFQNTLNLLLEPSIGPLKPEKIHTLELNYIASFSNSLSLNLSFFHNTLNNLITRIGELDENGDYQTWSANAGKLITHGFESTLYMKPLNNLNLDISWIFQKTLDKMDGHEGRTVPYSPNFLGYLKASYLHKKFTISIMGNYVGSMETYWDESFNGRIGDKVEGYFLMSANLRIMGFILKGLFCNLKVANIFDEEIRYPTYTNNAWADRGTLGNGRALLVSIGLKF
jgi:outer membrane receptor for ferrienterochelin and colicin